MSVELIHRAIELLNSDSLEISDAELAEIFTPDVVIDQRAVVFNPAIYESYDGLRAFYAESREVWEEVTLTVTEVIEEGDQYVVLGEGRSRGRGSGMEIAAGFTAIWTTEGGRLKHNRVISTMEADRELGLAALREQ
jgi:ketosteroid isomerase-like protein